MGPAAEEAAGYAISLPGCSRTRCDASRGQVARSVSVGASFPELIMADIDSAAAPRIPPIGDPVPAFKDRTTQAPSLPRGLQG